MTNRRYRDHAEDARKGDDAEHDAAAGSDP